MTAQAETTTSMFDQTDAMNAIPPSTDWSRGSRETRGGWTYHEGDQMYLRTMLDGGRYVIRRYKHQWEAAGDGWFMPGLYPSSVAAARAVEATFCRDMWVTSAKQARAMPAFNVMQ